MKKMLTNWRFWLILVQTCFALILVGAEPISDGSTTMLLVRLVISKVAGILLFVGVIAEWDLWKGHFSCLESILSDEKEG